MPAEEDSKYRMELRPMTPQDWDEVSRIYREGIETRLATFETQVPLWEKWDAGHLKTGRLIAEQAGKVLGWAALSPISTRSVYRGVAEVSIYVSADARQQGVGRALLLRLIAISEEAQIWTLQASIFRHNHPSISLHEKCGFRVVGHREKIAQLDDEWYDTTIMERRSTLVGV